MMKTIMLFVLLLIVDCHFASVTGQEARIVFYNVENLYDIEDDPVTRDEEFLPGGDKDWNSHRYYDKIIKIYKTFVAIGKGDMPAVIGLCEVENRQVLDRLVYDTPLSAADYRIIHRESQDARGVDVGFLYRPDIFAPDTTEWLTVPLSSGESTREIMHVRGRLWGKDTVDIYVNHWPSRFGGAGSSVSKRLAAAATLAASVKSVLKRNKNANIVAMGDYNDEPGDESLQSINKILENDSQKNDYKLINISEDNQFPRNKGTIKHQGVWSIFDQVLVSPALVSGTNGLEIRSENAEIFTGEFLLETDESHSGVKPYRTYTGPGYHGGFSDHLPVSIVVGRQ